MSSSTSPLFLPDTPDNRVLRSHVAPTDWTNPRPAAMYNLVVIGAGSGGLVTAAGAAGLGAKVALIEKHALGGDCLNVGCVPSKALIAAARNAAALRDAKAFGNRSENPGSTFSEVMDRMRRLRASIAPHDSADRFTKLGIDVFQGTGEFLDANTIAVGDARLRFRKAVIATGARASLIPIPGLAEADPLTNETLFSLTECPSRLVIIGAGPIGCEMAQSFARFGSAVTLLDAAPMILPREDPDAAEIVHRALEADGVLIRVGIKILRVEPHRRVIIETRDGEEEISADQILVGVGRAPNVEGMGLEKAGVEFDTRNGVKINKRLQTTQPHIYAVGDVCMATKFTHVADFTARIVIQNALFGGRKRHTDLLIPWSTYTDPEIAHVGLYEEAARKTYGETLQTFRQDFSGVDRSILESKTDGFVKVHAVKGKVVGATIVGEHAGDLISEISVVMKSGMKLGALANVIHPYPTTAEAIRKIGDQYNRGKLTPFIASLFRIWLAWKRGGDS